MHEAGRDDRTLRRIIATLVALAVLAERAAYRSLPIRWLLLCLLRHAENVVREHVAEATGWDWPDLGHAFGIDAAGAGLDTDHGAGNGPADAMALAWRLRMLAAVLGAFLSPDAGIDRENVSAVDALLALAAADPARLLATPFGRRHPAPDTS